MSKLTTRGQNTMSEIFFRSRPVKSSRIVIQILFLDIQIFFGYPIQIRIDYSHIGFGYNMRNIRRILDIRLDNPDSTIGY